MPRMKVFKALEEETFEMPPGFNTAERKRYAVGINIVPLFDGFHLSAQPQQFVVKFFDISSPSPDQFRPQVQPQLLTSAAGHALLRS